MSKVVVEVAGCPTLREEKPAVFLQRP